MKNKKLLQFLKLLLQIIVAALAGYGGSVSGADRSAATDDTQASVVMVAHRSDVHAADANLKTRC